MVTIKQHIKIISGKATRKEIMQAIREIKIAPKSKDSK